MSIFVPSTSQVAAKCRTMGGQLLSEGSFHWNFMKGFYQRVVSNWGELLLEKYDSYHSMISLDSIECFHDS